jgi:hypothetical protein
MPNFLIIGIDRYTVINEGKDVKHGYPSFIIRRDIYPKPLDIEYNIPEYTRIYFLFFQNFRIQVGHTRSPVGLWKVRKEE